MTRARGLFRSERVTSKRQSEQKDFSAPRLLYVGSGDTNQRFVRRDVFVKQNALSGSRKWRKQIFRTVLARLVYGALRSGSHAGGSFGLIFV